MKKLKLEELNRLSVEEFKETEKLPVVLILDNIRSMHNVGSVFRTADAFAIEKIYLCGITPTPPHKEIRKTALGATESVEWEYCEDALQLLQNLKNNYLLAAMEQTDASVELQNTNFKLQDNKGIAIILGNEVDGVSERLIQNCDHVIEIAQYGTKHSLNVSVCAGIVLYDISKKLRTSS
ncbi:MAG: RNA methyltransferase [Weeksellaceae bacterium]|nr:RNA methyltransferase [Weeksellaceae bacterium]